MKKVYGVINEEGYFFDVSNTEQGAKRIATIQGYNIIGYRYHYNVTPTHMKTGKRWVSYNCEGIK